MIEYRHGMRFTNRLGSVVVGVIGTGTSSMSAHLDAIRQLQDLLEFKQQVNPDTKGLFLDGSNTTTEEMEQLQEDWGHS